MLCRLIQEEKASADHQAEELETRAAREPQWPVEEPQWSNEGSFERSSPPASMHTALCRPTWGSHNDFSQSKHTVSWHCSVRYRQTLMHTC